MAKINLSQTGETWEELYTRKRLSATNSRIFSMKITEEYMSNVKGTTKSTKSEDTNQVARRNFNCQNQVASQS